MKCPLCAQHTPDAWLHVGWVAGSGVDFTNLHVEWMRCANPECKQALIRMSESHARVENNHSVEETVTWLARPRASTRPLDPLVEEPFRTDYLEAAAIIDLSPRMSAALSRHILGDLLEKYAGQDRGSLKSAIDKFVEETCHPDYLRENLQHLREIANFGTDTQKDAYAEIVDVDRDEAEWTLDVLDSLFDYFIVAPKRNRKIRKAMDRKSEAAGGKPVDSSGAGVSSRS
jgi:Domain of unknown function (DUF4145)